MNAQAVAIGFLVFVGAFLGTALFVAPNVGFLSPIFAFLGPYAGWVFSATITFPVLVLFLWAARKAGAHGEIPEAS